MFTPASPSPVPRPTRVRYLVVVLTTVMAFLLYLDRFCLSLAVTYIKQDMGLDGRQTDLLLGAFFFTYALGQVPAGWLSDRYGARLMLTVYILSWSLFTGLMGLAAGFAMVLALRLGCGLAQAGAYPTGAAVVRNWMPFVAWGRASGIVAVGGRIGGTTAPLLTALLIVAFVPVEKVSSRLRPGDVLAEATLRELVEHPPDTPQGKVAQVLSALLVPVGAKTMTAVPEGDELVAALNDVLGRPDLYERVEIQHFKLEQEARRLATIPARELSPREIERRNRLLLEAVFPDQIRKLYGAGWRPVMVVYGFAGILVAGAFWLGFRNQPSEHPNCNTAEVRLIVGDPLALPVRRAPVGGIPLAALLRSGNQWYSSLVQFCTNFGWTFLVTLLPGYLVSMHKVSLVEVGYLAAVPIFAGMFGMFAGGWVTDGLTRLSGQRWGRRLPIVLTRFAAGAAFVACLLLDSAWAVTIALAVVAVATDLGTPAIWAFCQDTGGRQVGSVLGWSNMWGNFGSALTPPVLGLIAAGAGWDWAFVSCATVFFVAGACSFGLDSTVRLLPTSK